LTVVHAREPSISTYTDDAIVDCLVCLDDDLAFGIWEGVMVTAVVNFSVNRVVVSPSLATLSVTGRTGTLPTASSLQRGLIDAGWVTRARNAPTEAD
jgi:hypothetical protein